MKKIIILIFTLFLLGCNLSTSNCKKGYHEFVEDEINETSDSTFIKYKCKNCFKSYEITTKNNKLYFENVWDYSIVYDLKIYSSIKFNEEANLNEYQNNYFNDLLEKMRRSELNYMNKMCDCTPKVEVGTKDNSVVFSFHNDHLVLKSVRRGNDYWEIIQPCLNFKLEMFNEIYEWVSIENNIINSEYDYISDKDLKYLSTNCNSMKFDIGFDELIATEGRVLKSSSSTEQFNELINSYYNPQYYHDIEVVEIIETDYYYCAVMNYLYESSNKIRESYLISFKQNVYDNEKNEIYIEDEKIIKLILDTLFYYRIEDISGFSVVHSQIIEEQDCFIYVKYEVNTIFGDWGVTNTAKFIRSIYRIDKNSSIVENMSNQTINTVFYKD